MILNDTTITSGFIETQDLDKQCPRCGCKKGELKITWEKKKILFFWISVPVKLEAYTITTLNVDVDGQGPIPPIPVTYYKCLRCGWNRMIAKMVDMQNLIDLGANLIQKK